MKSRIYLSLASLSFAAVLTLSAVTSCGKKSSSSSSSPGGTVTLSVQSLQVKETAASLVGNRLGASLGLADPAAALVSFTPAKFMVPIYAIMLSNSTVANPTGQATATTGATSAPLYTCTGKTDADCYVDVTSQAALDKLTASVYVPPGNFDTIGINNCADGSKSYVAQVTGQLKTADGTTYQTASSSTAPLSSTATTAAPTSLTFTGCATTFKIPGGLKIASDGTMTTAAGVSTPAAGPTPTVKNANGEVEQAFGNTVSVSLYLTVKDIAWGGIGFDAIAGCTGPGSVTAQVPPSAQVVCAAYPTVVAYLGTTATTVKNYRIQNTTTNQSADMQFILDKDGNFIGGFSRPYFDGVSGAIFGFTGSVDGFDAGTSSTNYKVTTTGGSGNNVNYDHYVTFPAFQLATHTGTATVMGASMPYKATAQ